MQSGSFITIEGTEGVGKSTVMRAIQLHLEASQQNFIQTREPGGTPLAEALRELLLNNHNEAVTSDTELLLMFAGRSQHVSQVIKPALMSGKWVLSDRFTDASYAYQGGGRGVSTDKIDFLAEWLQAGVSPDLTLLLDAPVAVGLGRMKQRDEPDRIEQEKEAFFERVREAYLNRAKAEPNRFVVIDATQTPEQVATQAVGAIKAYQERVS